MKTILSPAGLGLATSMAFAGWIRNPETVPAPTPMTYAQSRVETYNVDRDRSDRDDRVSYNRDQDRYRTVAQSRDRDDRYRTNGRYADRDDRSRDGDRDRVAREYSFNHDNDGRR
jgi:hypothetical protein